MAIQNTSNLTNSIRTQYIETYKRKAFNSRLYDQFAIPVEGISMDQAIKGSAVQMPFIGSMTIGTAAIPEDYDVTPQALTDAVASITPTSRYGSLQWTEKLDIQTYTNYAQERMEKLGDNQQETVEAVAVGVAAAGNLVLRATTRANLDAGTPSHRISDSWFAKADGMMLTLKIPGYQGQDGSQAWGAILHPFAYHDILESGNVDAIGLYQNMGIHLNWELGKIGNFRLSSSPWAKVFGGAGADNATNVATTVGTASTALATTLVTTDDVSSSASAGLMWTVGTEETANTFYPMNERFYVVSASTYTLTIIGEGENGGLRFPHDATTVAVRNADSVYTVIFGGPASMVKLYAPGNGGEFGEVVGPHITGNLEQFGNVGWKWYGNYGVFAQNRLLRIECSVSQEA